MEMAILKLMLFLLCYFQTFDVKLISVTGGALLGPASTVRIAILKNDSPNGLFRFVTAEVGNTFVS